MGIKAPRLTYDRLRQTAEEFIGQYHASRSLPVPIEEIVEFDFGIDIVEMPGLHDLLEVDAYPTSDFTEIHVDQNVYRRFPSRYRFSLAHEIAHLVLHKDIFSQLRFRSIEEWKSVVLSIPAEQYSWIEWQAYSLAGIILVPCPELRREFNERIETAESAGVFLQDIIAEDEAKVVIESHIARTFAVSRAVVRKRLDKESLWQPR